MLEAEAGKSLQVQAQPVLHSEILFVFVVWFFLLLLKNTPIFKAIGWFFFSVKSLALQIT